LSLAVPRKQEQSLLLLAHLKRMAANVFIAARSLSPKGFHKKLRAITFVQNQKVVAIICIISLSLAGLATKAKPTRSFLVAE